MRIKRDFIFDPSLMLHLPLWKLDGTKFRSEDAYGHLATVTGATWGLQGRSFNGIGNVIDCGNNSIFGITGAITIEAWAKFAGIATSQTICGKDLGGSSYAFELDWEPNPFLNFGFYSVALGWHRIQYIWTPSITTFYQIVGVYDKAYLRLYLNGLPVGIPLAETNDRPVNAGNVRIGRQSGATTYPFNGLIGEVRIYNRALNPLEIQHNYLATKWRYSS